MSINKKLSASLLGVVSLLAAGACLAQPADAHPWHDRAFVHHEMRVERRLAAQQYFAAQGYAPYYAPVVTPMGTYMRAF